MELSEATLNPKALHLRPWDGQQLRPCFFLSILGALA